MTNKQALEIVLEAAEHSADILAPQNDRKKKILAAIQTVEAYLDYDDNIRED